MIRTVAAILLLSSAVFLSTWSCYTLNKELNTLLYSVEETLYTAETKNDSSLKIRTEKLLGQWQKSSVILHSLSMHEGIDELEECIIALPLIIEHHNRDEFKSECIEAINRIKNLLNSEKIRIENIL